MDGVGGVDVGLPGAARGGDGRVGTAGRAAVVPDDDDVRGAVAVGQLDQAFAVRAAGDVVHAVADLERLAVGGAAGGDVDAVGALEDLLVALDVAPQDGLR